MADKPQTLFGTEPLDGDTDFGRQTLEGLSALLDRKLRAADRERRARLARLEFEKDRERLARIIGVIDQRLPVEDLQIVATVTEPVILAETAAYTVTAVRWPVLPGVEGEGLLLQPKKEPIAHVIAVPDADWSPEAVAGLDAAVPHRAQFARRLAEYGCQVVVPTLIDRDCRWSGNPGIRMTNQPHREFVYRMAYQMGRHVIGYEVQKILSLVDLFSNRQQSPIILFGYGEGGMLALYSTALDERISGVGVSGYFANRYDMWKEPIYRNVWQQLRGFSDAEVAAHIAPRPLVIEASPGPQVDGPPPPTDSRKGAAPGRLAPASLAEVREEVALARLAYKASDATERIVLVEPGENEPAVGTDKTLMTLLNACGISVEAHMPEGEGPLAIRSCDAGSRQRRQFRQLCGHCQRLWQLSAKRRKEFWKGANSLSPSSWQEHTEPYRDHFRNEVIGSHPEINESLDPRSRLIESTPDYALYEVVIHVWEGVPAFAYMLVPHGVTDHEKRPVVVCQHGLGGQPRAVLEEGTYKAMARRLAVHGYVVLAPQNPSIGPAGDAFRVLQRKANPLGLSLFSFITGIHEAWLAWLATFPFVDNERIAMYGLSYGGKTALRVPALLKQYAVVICSGDFNEWIMKTVSVDFFSSYMFTGEYEIFEFGLGESFNHAEMVYLIAPRPFMVERGHNDGCSTDEWVAFEYAKVRYLYDQMGIGDLTELEIFSGGHEINLQGTLRFLDRHLGWKR
ncbi:MAG: alpha/beta hydrolase family protein [Limnochordia bacterium]